MKPVIYITTADGVTHEVRFGKASVADGKAQFNPAEERDYHGRWTAGGSSHMTPEQRSKRRQERTENERDLSRLKAKSLPKKGAEPLKFKLAPGDNLHAVPKALQSRTEVQTGDGSAMVTKEPGLCSLTTGALDEALAHGSFSTFTAANPMGNPLPPEENAKRNAMLKEELTKLGAIFHECVGVYTNDAGVTTQEPSFMVHHTEGITPALINSLANKYEQETALHYTKGHTTIQYASGPKRGEAMLTLEHYTRKPAKDAPQTYVPGAGKFAMDGIKDRHSLLRDDHAKA